MELLQLYDKNKNKKAGLTEYKDLCIESVLTTGDKKLSFSYSKEAKYYYEIVEEGYIRTKKDEFVIKAKDIGVDYTRFDCVLNLETLEANIFDRFESVEQTITNALNLAIVRTGWTVKDTTLKKKRTVRCTNKNALEIVQEIKKTYRVDIVFNTLKREIEVYEHLGQDKGAYFIDSLNLTALQVQSDSYKFATRIIAEGKDGLTFSSINNGKNYVENYQYSRKVKTIYWKDERYTIKESLLEDAKAKLREISKPYISYSASILNLAKLNPKYKDILDYRLGDTITLISKNNKVKDKQRIVKTVEYPNDHSRDTVELANAILKFEDIQQENQETTDTVNNITTDNGTVDGSTIDSIQVKQIEDFKANVVEVVNLKAINANIDNLHANKADIQDLHAVTAKIGTLEATKADITQLNAVNADISNLNAIKADITDLNAANGKIAILESKTASIDNLLSQKASINDLNALNATISEALIKKATIAQLEALETKTNNLIADKANIKDLNVINANINSLKTYTADIKTLLNGNLSSENIQTKGITSDKLVIANGFIKDAMIDSVNVNKLNAGVLTTDKFNIRSRNGNLIIKDNTIQIKDSSKVRVQVGKDASGDYSLYVWDKLGNLMFNALGITKNAIKDKIIRNDMVSDDASIEGKKLNIESVVREVNNCKSNLKAYKIDIDTKGQTLDVAFSELVTENGKNKEEIVSLITKLNVAQGKINASIENSKVLEGKQKTLEDNYNRTVATVDSLKNTIGSHKTLIDSATGKIARVEIKANTLEKNLNGLTQTITATKKVIENNKTSLESKNAELKANIDKVSSSLSSVSNTVDKNNKVLDTKANTLEQTLSGLTQTVSSNKSTTDGKITSVENVTHELKSGLSGLTSKLDTLKSLTNGINKTVINQGSAINQLQDSIKLKVDSSTFTQSTQTINNNINKAKEEAINTANNTIDNLRISSRNLAINSNFNFGLRNWGFNNPNNNATVQIIKDSVLGNCVKVTTQTSGQGVYSILKRKHKTTYSWSFMIKSDKTCKITVSHECGEGTKEISLTTEWTKITGSGLWNGDGGSLCFYSNGANPKITYYLTNLIYVEGNKVGDWTPAPDDLQAYADAVAIAKSELVKEQSKAYADGIVTVEEQKRIQQAQANLNAAISKATEAENKAKYYTDSKKQEAIKTAENLALEKSNLAKKYADAVAKAKADLAQANAIANADGKITVEEKKRIQQAQENLNTAISKADKAKQDAINEANRVAELKKQEAINSANSHADSKANEALNNAKAFVNAEITTVNSHLNKATAEINVLKKQIELKVGQSDVDKSIEDVKFGGRNLWLNTAFLNGTNHFGFYGCENINVINIENEDYKAVEFVSNNLNGGIYQRNCGNNQKTIPFEKGENLIISGYFKCSSTAKLRVSLEGSSYSKSFTPKASNEWTYFELKAVSDGVVHTFTLYGSNNNKYTIRQIKVEKGTKTTDWTKAPEDTDQLIVDNIKTVTDKISTVESKFTQENNGIKASVQDLNSTTQTITTNVSNINRDLTSKINSNLDVAKSFATDIAIAKANLAKEQAIANADGKITEEERKRIQQAETNLNVAIARADKAKVDAKVYSDTLGQQLKANAEKYANDVAVAKSELVKEQSKAYADGIVTVEEQKRIDEAKKNLNTAIAKATEAENKAKYYTDSKKQEAIKAAENLALEKSNLAKKYADAVAKAKADLAQANAIANADGKITVEEKKRIQQAQENLNTAIARADKAKADAKAYSDTLGQQLKANAEKYANDVAVAKSELAKEQSKAYADGVVTEEEKRRIAEAKKNLDTAIAKATEAETKAKSYADSKKQEAIKAAENLALEKSNLAKKYADDVAAAKANLAKTEAIANADGKITAEEQKRIQQAQANLNAAISKADKAKQDAINEANRVAELKKQDAINSANSHADSKANEALNNAKAYTNAEITTVNSKVHNVESNLNILSDRINTKVSQSDIDKAVTTIRTERIIYARGTGNDYPANSIVKVNGKTITDGQGRGLRINALNKSTLERVFLQDYDTFGSEDAKVSFVNKINELNNGDFIIIITSQDASYPLHQPIKEALEKIGATLFDNKQGTFREAYALIGKSKLGRGNGVEMFIPRTANDKRFAEVSVKVGEDGTFIGVNPNNMGLEATLIKSNISDISSELTQTKNSIEAKISSINSKTQSIESNLNGKATKQEVTNVNSKVTTLTANLNSITQRVSNSESKTHTLENTINGKANKQDITNVSNKVASIETNVNGITQRVSNTESRVNTLNGQIQNATTKQEFTEFKQGYDNFTYNVSKNFGSKNLIRNSGFLYGYNYFYPITSNFDGHLDLDVWTDNSEWVVSDTCALVIRGGNFTKGACGARQDGIKLKPNTKYTIAFSAAAHRCKWRLSLNTNGWGQLVWVEGNSSGGKDPNNWDNKSITFTTGPSASEITNCKLDLVMQNRNANDPYAWFTNLILVEGDFAPKWTPMTGENYSNTVVIDKDKIKTMFEDGTYAQMGRDGFEWYNAGTGHSYHALTYVTSFDIPIGNPGKVYIRLPAEFTKRRSSLKWTVALRGYYYNTTGNFFPFHVHCTGARDYIENGLVVCEVQGLCKIQNGSNSGDVQFRPLTAMLIAIA